MIEKNREQATGKPANRTAIYLRIITNYRPQKQDTYRIRFTVGGNRMDCAGNILSSITKIATVDLHFNSVILDINVSYKTIDIKD